MDEDGVKIPENLDLSKENAMTVLADSCDRTNTVSYGTTQFEKLLLDSIDLTH